MKILDKYYDPKNPGSFSGLSGFLKNNKVNKIEAKKLLQSTENYTHHRPVKYKFDRGKFFSKGIDHIWQIDLIDVSNLKNKSYGQWYNFLFVCIDVFSKYAWVIPIAQKQAKQTAEALKKILESNRIPKIIYSDKGTEFSGEFQKLCKKQSIRQIYTKSIHKAAVVERFNRTLKEKLYRLFTYKKSKNYIDDLESVVEAYNNSYHRSIRMSPSDVNKSNSPQVLDNLYGDLISYDNPLVFNLNIGDYVRIPIEKKKFEKGYTQKWSSDVYIITQKLPINPAQYTIKALTTEKKLGTLYEPELQKIEPKEFPYDTLEVLKETDTQILVKQLNDEKQKEYWIEKDQKLSKSVEKFSIVKDFVSNGDENKRITRSSSRKKS